MLSLIAILSGESIFVHTTDKREEAIEAHRKFESEYGDHLTLLKVFKAYQECDKINVRKKSPNLFTPQQVLTEPLLVSRSGATRII